MKTEKEIKCKIENLKLLQTSTLTEHHIKKIQIDMLEWMLSEEPKFKIFDKVVYKNDGCEFLGEIVRIQDKMCKVVFVNCVIDHLDIDEVNLQLFSDKRYYNFKNN
jgi:hypothetical protein